MIKETVCVNAVSLGGDSLREKIIDSAREQIFKNGLKGFTMDDICHDLVMSKKTLYKHFSSKKELISSVVDLHVRNDKAATLKAIERETEPAGRLKAVINCYYEYRIPLKVVDDFKKYLPSEWQKVDELFAFKRQLFIKLFLEGKECGLFNPDINTDVLMLMLEKSISAIMNYEFLAAHDMNYMTVNRLLDVMKRIVFYGVVKRD